MKWERSSEAEPRATAVNPYEPTIMSIAAREDDAPGVFSLTFDVPGGFPFEPGQFNMLYVRGVGEVPISISGDCARPERLFHTIRAVGRVTTAMAALREGDLLGVRGPYGRGWPLAQAAGRDVVFVAGGLGLAPLRPAILRVLHDRDRYGRVIVLYGARTPLDMLLRNDLAQWRGRFDVELDAIVDRAPSDWRGSVGVVTTLIERARIDASSTVAMVCGPEMMMRVSARTLAARGVPPSSIHLSMERSMKCGVALCGHCQWGPTLVCRDGPVYSYERALPLLGVKEL